MQRLSFVVLAKLPRPGLAKTRLVPALGEPGAARLAERLLCEAVAAAASAAMEVRRVGQAGHAMVELCLTPTTDDPLAAALAARHGVALARQTDGDLGARMAVAARRHLGVNEGGAQHDVAHETGAREGALSGGARRAVLLMGTDAPALDAALLGEAAARLATHDAVLVPAADGGYAALGLTRFAPSLFDAMPWSTGAVLAETRGRLAAAGFTWSECRTVHDIDVPEDLVHLPLSWRTAAIDPAG